MVTHTRSARLADSTQPDLRSTRTTARPTRRRGNFTCVDAHRRACTTRECVHSVRASGRPIGRARVPIGRRRPHDPRVDRSPHGPDDPALHRPRSPPVASRTPTIATLRSSLFSSRARTAARSLPPASPRRRSRIFLWRVRSESDSPDRRLSPRFANLSPRPVGAPPFSAVPFSRTNLRVSSAPPQRVSRATRAQRTPDSLRPSRAGGPPRKQSLSGESSKIPATRYEFSLPFIFHACLPSILLARALVCLDDLRLPYVYDAPRRSSGYLLGARRQRRSVLLPPSVSAVSSPLFRTLRAIAVWGPRSHSTTPPY